MVGIITFRRNLHVSNTVKVQDPNTGELVDGKIVKVIEAREPFSYITLEDGSEITMRTTVSRVVRHINQWDQDGNPMYTIDGNGIVTINAPKELKRDWN